MTRFLYPVWRVAFQVLSEAMVCPPTVISKIRPPWEDSAPSSSTSTALMEPSPLRPLRATWMAMVFSPAFSSRGTAS